jgi:hypothetical protein
LNWVSRHGAGPAGPVEIKFRTTGHLRCSPAAAMQLRDSLIAAIDMLEKSTTGAGSGQQCPELTL